MWDGSATQRREETGHDASRHVHDGDVRGGREADIRGDHGPADAGPGGRPAYAGVIARARVAGGADHSASRGRLWTPRSSPRRRVWASGGWVPLDVRHPAPGTRQPAPRPWDHLGGLRGVPGRHRADQVAVVVPRNRPDVTRAETLRELGPRARRHRLLFAGGDATYPLRRRR